MICPEEKVSNHERLSYHQSLATDELLKELFSHTHYHGIVNFIHYKDVEDYKKVHPLLIQNTDHLIFLSSYRVYADEEHAITENAPRLLDVSKDEEFLATGTYALSKAKCEDYLRRERAGEPWTIVRPVISFSSRRLDLLLYSGRDILDYAESGKDMLLPSMVKDFTAGFDWAGNSGKQIANLLSKPHTIGNTYSIYSGHGMTWGQVAECYAELTGVKIRWCDEDEYVKKHTKVSQVIWAWLYDRRFNRDIDPSAVLFATGLKKEDFVSVKEGIKQELALLGWRR